MRRDKSLRYAALDESSNTNIDTPMASRVHHIHTNNTAEEVETGSSAPPSSSFQFNSFPASLPRIQSNVNRTPSVINGSSQSVTLPNDVTRGIFSVMEEWEDLDSIQVADAINNEPADIPNTHMYTSPALDMRRSKTPSRKSSIHRHRTRRWQSHYNLRRTTSSSSSSTCSSSNNNDTSSYWLSPLARRKEYDGDDGDAPIAETVHEEDMDDDALSHSPPCNSPPLMHANLFPMNHTGQMDPIDLEQIMEVDTSDLPEQTWLHESKINRAFTPYRQKKRMESMDNPISLNPDPTHNTDNFDPCSPNNQPILSQNDEGDNHLKLHFESQYSPIPKISEDLVQDFPLVTISDQDHTYNHHEEDHVHLSNHPRNLHILSNHRNTSANIHNHPNEEDVLNKSLDTSFLSHHSDASSTSTNKQRKNARPMPDMSAFDMGLSEITTTSSIQSGGEVTQNQVSNLTDGAVVGGSEKRIPTFSSRMNTAMGPTRWLCPPTPMRTPAWAQDGHHLHRADSLIVTKVLAACPQHILDGLSSLENSFMEEGDNRTAGGSLGSDLPPVPHNESVHNHRDKSLLVSFATVMEENEVDVSSNSLESEARVRVVHEDKKDRSFSLAKRRHSSPLDNTFHDDNEGDFQNIKHGNNTSKLIKSDQSIMDHSFVGDDTDRRNSSGSYSSKSGPIQSTISFHTDFEVLTKLGSGSFADVFKARCKSDGHIYAIKRSRRRFRGKRDRDRALYEVRIMQQLQTVNVQEDGRVKNSCLCVYLLFFIRAWQEEGHFFCQTELCCRDSCRQLLLSLTSDWAASSVAYPSLIKNLHLGNDVDDVQSVADHKHLLPESTLWKLCHDVSAGLSYIHGQNIVHLDIKPDNIFFVSHVRLGAICKIGDFGLARHVDSMEEGEEGDTAYMSSELLLSSDLKYPKKCDIFSLGLTLYELSCDNLELPVEGPRWHELRCGDHDPILPPIRSGALKDMIKCMISRSQDRPSADMILSHDKVTAAGSWYDNFLHDYIHDIEVADIEREKRLSEIHLESRYTPTHFIRRSSLASDHTRTPTPR